MLCFMDLYDKLARLWTMWSSGQLLGIRDGDEVGVGFLPAQVEMRWGRTMALMAGEAQAKYMVLRVS